MTLTLLATRTRHEIIDLTISDEETPDTFQKLLRPDPIEVTNGARPPPAKKLKREYHSPHKQQPQQHIHPSPQLPLRSPSVQPTTYSASSNGFRHKGTHEHGRKSRNTATPQPSLTSFFTTQSACEEHTIKPPTTRAPSVYHAAATSVRTCASPRPATQLQTRQSPQDVLDEGPGAREPRPMERAVSITHKPPTQREQGSNTRPYIRERIRRKLDVGGSKYGRLDVRDGSVAHVGFTAAETDVVLGFLRRGAAPGLTDSQLAKRCLEDMFCLRELSRLEIPGRTYKDIIAFVKETAKGTLEAGQLLVFKRQLLSDIWDERRRADYSRLLATRRTLGSNHDAIVLGGRYVDVRCELSNAVDDELKLRTEWMGASGDVITMSWTSDNAFIAGATTNSDPLNQQYNKTGNLLLGSVSNQVVRSLPDHRIPRPIITKGENASAEMVESQSPWLYTSVVFSAYEDGIAYSCGFDNTAKLWEVQEDGASMKLLGTWLHGGKVNYVMPSKHRDADQSFRMVATAADVSPEAVRVYRINKQATNISGCQYRTFSASRTTGEGSDKWAYFPATMAWGRASGLTTHLLLAGYSPRSLSWNDNDIPEEKRNSGELRLWDGITGEAWKVSTASMCNVFEVAWHPSKKMFAAAVSPSGERGDETKTQIRLYSSYKVGDATNKVYSEFKCLDCAAAGINYGLTIMPYGPRASYVAVGCTDGNTYVWDTEAPESTPYRVLSHGRPILDPIDDQEAEDVGVQFVAWGNSLERLYTGSTDGTVRIWNIRTEGNPLTRVLLECKGAVTSGAFSPDKSKLVIGDGSGVIYLLTTHDVSEDEWDGEEETPPEPDRQLHNFVRIQHGNGLSINRRRPNLVKPHLDPPDPTHDAAGNLVRRETGIQRGKMYLERQQLVLHRNPVVGAVQGPRYAEMGLYYLDGHMDDTDGESPLLAIWERVQQGTHKRYSKGIISGARLRGERGIIQRTDVVRDQVRELHQQNLDRSFYLGSLDQETRRALEAEGAELDLLEESVTGNDESEGDSDHVEDVAILSD